MRARGRRGSAWASAPPRRHGRAANRVLCPLCHCRLLIGRPGREGLRAAPRRASRRLAPPADRGAALSRAWRAPPAKPRPAPPDNMNKQRTDLRPGHHRTAHCAPRAQPGGRPVGHALRPGWASGPRPSPRPPASPLSPHPAGSEGGGWSRGSCVCLRGAASHPVAASAALLTDRPGSQGSGPTG